MKPQEQEKNAQTTPKSIVPQKENIIGSQELPGYENEGEITIEKKILKSLHFIIRRVNLIFPIKCAIDNFKQKSIAE